MTVRVERTFEFAAPPERVWEFIADPGKRAEAISVVDSWETEGEETTWHIELPIPLISRTIAVRTRDTERVTNERVQFVGRSSVMAVEGEHELEPVDGGTRLVNRFTVEGRLPGVERFFERNLDGELTNLKHALERDLGLEA
jgi:carbon monoxide dehydrogenase subunit G